MIPMLPGCSKQLRCTSATWWALVRRMRWAELVVFEGKFFISSSNSINYFPKCLPCCISAWLPCTLTELSGDQWGHGVLPHLWDGLKVGLSSEGHCCVGRQNTSSLLVELLTMQGQVSGSGYSRLTDRLNMREEDICVYLWLISHSSFRDWPGSSGLDWADPSRPGTKKKKTEIINCAD